jgi:hypothetical protein
MLLVGYPTERIMLFYFLKDSHISHVFRHSYVRQQQKGKNYWHVIIIAFWYCHLTPITIFFSF